MKHSGKGKKAARRLFCLLYCLWMLAGFFPAQVTEAASASTKLSSYWTWDRVDSITDFSAANLNKYSYMLLMYEDGGQKYVLGVNLTKSYGTPSLPGYHSMINGYSTCWNSSQNCWFKSSEHDCSEEYGRYFHHGYNLKSLTLSEAKAIDNEIEYGADSFITMENISDMPIKVDAANSKSGRLEFKMYYDSKTDDNEISGNLKYTAAMWLGSQYWEGGYDKTRKNWVYSYGSTWTGWSYNKALGYGSNTQAKRIEMTSPANTGYIYTDPSYDSTVDVVMNYVGSYVFAERVDQCKDYYSWQWVENSMVNVAHTIYQMPFVMYLGSGGSYTCLNSFTVTTGNVISIDSGTQAFVMDWLKIEPGAVLVLDGTLINNGKIENYGTILIREGGVISTPLYDKNPNDSSGVLICYGSSQTYQKAKGEGGVIIEKGGRLMVKDDLMLYGGSSVINNGELILAKGIKCESGKSELTMRTEGFIWLGYEFDFASCKKNGFTSTINMVSQWADTARMMRENGEIVFMFQNGTEKKTFYHKYLKMERQLSSDTLKQDNLTLHFEESNALYQNYRNYYTVADGEAVSYQELYLKWRVFGSSRPMTENTGNYSLLDMLSMIIIRE